MDDWSKVYLIIAVAGMIITAIRSFSACKSAEDQQKISNESAMNLEQKLQNAGFKAEHAVSTGSISLCYDESKRTIGSLDALSGSVQSIPIDDIAAVSVDDRVEEYKHAQEMEQLYTGVTRHSLASPYGHHSTKEVKNGHETFQSMIGSRIFTIILELKNGQKKELACLHASEALMWTRQQEEWLNKLNGFVSTVCCSIHR